MYLNLFNILNVPVYISILRLLGSVNHFETISQINATWKVEISLKNTVFKQLTGDKFSSKYSFPERQGTRYKEEWFPSGCPISKLSFWLTFTEAPAIPRVLWCRRQSTPCPFYSIREPLTEWLRSRLRLADASLEWRWLRYVWATAFRSMVVLMVFLHLYILDNYYTNNYKYYFNFLLFVNIVTHLQYDIMLFVNTRNY